MEKKEYSLQLDKIISKHLRIPQAELRSEIAQEEEFAWDSVTHLKMISEIENNFKIKFEIDEIVSLEDVGKIRTLVEKKLRGLNGG